MDTGRSELPRSPVCPYLGHLCARTSVTCVPVLVPFTEKGRRRRADATGHRAHAFPCADMSVCACVRARVRVGLRLSVCARVSARPARV